jgi:uncharacterized protein (UPF0332 family)
VTPVAADLLRKANTSLGDADIILKAGVPTVGAREAYMAVFHAAQALVHDREGKVPKTHAGVQQRFALLAMADDALGEEAGRFLSRAYDYKDISDYRTDRFVGQEECAEVIARARRFVDSIEAILGAPPTH